MPIDLLRHQKEQEEMAKKKFEYQSPTTATAPPIGIISQQQQLSGATDYLANADAEAQSRIDSSIESCIGRNLPQNFIIPAPLMLLTPILQPPPTPASPMPQAVS